MLLNILQWPHAADLPLPHYASDSAAGLDLVAANFEPLVLKSLERTLVPTGLSIELEQGFEAQVRPRSGLAFQHGVTVLNAPGTIDADYRGEIKVLLINLGSEPFKILRGMRIAQLVIAPVVFAKIQAINILSETKRGVGGFGSTGC